MAPAPASADPVASASPLSVDMADLGWAVKVDDWLLGRPAGGCANLDGRARGPWFSLTPASWYICGLDELNEGRVSVEGRSVGPRNGWTT